MHASCSKEGKSYFLCKEKVSHNLFTLIPARRTLFYTVVVKSSIPVSRTHSFSTLHISSESSFPFDVFSFDFAVVGFYFDFEFHAILV